MRYAKKLNFPINPFEFNKSGRVIGRHAFTKDVPQGRLVRKYAPKDQVKKVESVLPNELVKHLLIINYSEIHLLKAHIHVEDKCVINFYQKTSGEVTTFWEGPIEPDDSFTTDNGNNYVNLTHENLVIRESFTAEDGDIWLLNTKQLHSVSKPYTGKPRARHFAVLKDEAPRYALQVFFTAPFEHVAQILEDKNLVIHHDK